MRLSAIRHFRLSESERPGISPIVLHIVALTALILAGCGGESPPQSSSQSAAEDQSSTEDEQSSDVGGSEQPSDDLSSDNDEPPQEESDPEPPSEEPPPEDEDEPLYLVGGVSVGIETLSESVILQLNDEQVIEVASDGTFGFSTELPEGSEYAVAMTTFPQSPGGEPRCSLTGAEGIAGEGSEDALHLRCIPPLAMTAEFVEAGLLFTWPDIKATSYDVYAMPVGTSDISNYAAYTGAELEPNADSSLAAKGTFQLGERDFIIEARFDDGHRFQSDPLTELNATPLGGIIQTDQLLTEDSSPYKLYEDVQLAHETTANVGPAVHLEGDGRDFVVFGNFEVVGDADNSASINDLHIVPGSNSPSDPPFRIDLSFLAMNGGSLYYPTGNAIYGKLGLTDSVIENIPYVHIWYPVEDVIVARNVFVDAGGLSIGLSNGISATVENNAFVRSQGDGFSSQYAVQSWATYDTSELIVTKNSFLSTDRIAVELRPGYSNAAMDAQENYWGTTDEGVIEAMIYDRNDDLSTAGLIPYHPYLSDPHPNTPHVGPDTLDP